MLHHHQCQAQISQARCRTGASEKIAFHEFEASGREFGAQRLPGLDDRRTRPLQSGTGHAALQQTLRQAAIANPHLDEVPHIQLIDEVVDRLPMAVCPWGIHPYEAHPILPFLGSATVCHHD